MVELGTACSISNIEELKAWFAPLRDNAEHLATTSQKAKEYTERNLGATELITREVLRQLGDRR